MMRPIKTILVPVDFSRTSSKAAEYAARLAGRSPAHLILLHVIAPLAYDMSDTAWAVDQFSAVRALAERLLGELARRLARTGVKTRTALVMGSPAVAIVQAAKGRHADLIVMGTHGRTGFEHLMLGSVAERVVRLSPIPVLTVRGEKPRRRGRASRRRPLPLI